MKWETIQSHVGVTPDGMPGARTAAAVARALGIDEEEIPIQPKGESSLGFSLRSKQNIATLLPEVQPIFRKFLREAKKIGKKWNVTVKIIGGSRSYAEQDALFAQGRTKPGKRVTRARAGYSLHNFGIAADLGLFAGTSYLDDTDPALASKIYKQIAVAGRALGLEWGGDWTSIVDEPHFQVKTGLSTAQMRQRVKEGRDIV